MAVRKKADLVKENAALLGALKALVGAGPIKRCHNGDWSCADAVNYCIVRRAERAIAAAEGREEELKGLDNA